MIGQVLKARQRKGKQENVFFSSVVPDLPAMMLQSLTMKPRTVLRLDPG